MHSAKESILMDAHHRSKFPSQSDSKNLIMLHAAQFPGTSCAIFPSEGLRVLRIKKLRSRIMAILDYCGPRGGGGISESLFGSLSSTGSGAGAGAGIGGVAGCGLATSFGSESIFVPGAIVGSVTGGASKSTTPDSCH